jgi:hypothetical protein
MLILEESAPQTRHADNVELQAVLLNFTSTEYRGTQPSDACLAFLAGL